MPGEKPTLKKLTNWRSLIRAAWKGAIEAAKTLPSEIPGYQAGAAFCLAWRDGPC